MPSIVFGARDNSSLLVQESFPKLHTKLTNWELYRSQIDDALPRQIPLKSNDDIEKAVEIFNATVQQAAWSSTPRSHTKKVHSSTDLAVRELIHVKRKLRKNWQQNRNPLDKRKLNKATKELRIALHNKND